MRKVSLIAAVFFAVAWLAVAEDGSKPQPTPWYLQHTPTPTDDSDASKTIAPQYTPRPVFVPTRSADGAPPMYVTPNGTPMYVTPTLVAPPHAPTAATWQIQRTDSDMLLLNTATGETWFLEKSGDRPRKWTPIARDASPPVYTPAVPVPGPGAIVPPQEGERPALPPPAYHPPVQPPQEGAGAAEWPQWNPPANGDYVPASNRS